MLHVRRVIRDADNKDGTLRGEHIRDTLFERCDFTRCHMVGCRFQNCHFSRCTFASTWLDADRKPHSVYEKCTFMRCKMRRTYWGGAEIRAASFIDCQMVSTSFAWAKADQLAFIGKVESIDFRDYSIALGSKATYRSGGTLDLSGATTMFVELRGKAKFSGLVLPPGALYIPDFKPVLPKLQASLRQLVEARPDLAEESRRLGQLIEQAVGSYGIGWAMSPDGLASMFSVGWKQFFGLLQALQE